MHSFILFCCVLISFNGGGVIFGFISLFLQKIKEKMFLDE